jgi:hypothetical protein
VDRDVKLRKFACIDPGNTLLSITYFEKNAHKLPREAQKTAAENLLKAASWYDIETTDTLKKTAGVFWKSARRAWFHGRCRQGRSEGRQALPLQHR